MRNFTVRLAVEEDRDAICELLPRLAAFEIPERRQHEDLWRGDREALLQWLDGSAPHGAAHVAVDNRDRIVGIVFARLGKEALSREPSAHLEVLAVAEEAEGRGIASALVAQTEKAVVALGARSITLHVFACNTRARGLYEKLGYDGELVRYIKELD